MTVERGTTTIQQLQSRDAASLQARKQPKQERSRMMVDAILTAAHQILKKHGPDGLTVAALCQRAGASPGSIYQYFQSMDAVIYGLLQRHVSDITDRALDALHGNQFAPASQLISALVNAYIDAHRDDPATHSIVSYLICRSAGRGLEADLLRPVQDALAVCIQHRLSPSDPRDPRLLAMMFMRALESTTHEAVCNRPELLHESAFAASLCQMLLALLALEKCPHQQRQ